MKASAAIAKILEQHKVQYCFELVGGMITHLLDSLAENGRCTIISMHHEQAAAFAAEGVARQARGTSIALALGTSGPGATNLLTGVGSCWFDSIPCLFVTGQVNVNELKGDRAIRQQGFQELDIVSMSRSITKYSGQVTEVGQLLPELHRALSLAQSGRKGPVLLDIPNNIQRMDIPDEVVGKWLAQPLDTEYKKPAFLSKQDAASVAALCHAAKRPLVCFGGGARWAASMGSWTDSLERHGIPYVSTLMGHERIRVSRHYFNMIGSYGNREANWAVQNCDLLLVLGARLDVRQTGADVADFARHAKIIQVDIDPAQLDNRVKVELKICTDIEVFFKQFKITADTFPCADANWVAELITRRERHDVDEYPDWRISPHKIFKQLNETLRGQAVNYVCDVGNHQMWAAQGIRLGADQAVHYSGGMGAMGFALPAAIGIGLSSPKRTIVITGDGSLQVNSQELDTLNRLELNLTIIVMNNFSLGMVKNFQDMYFDGRNQSTRKGYSCPSFAKLAEAYGLRAIQINDTGSLQPAFEIMAGNASPLLIEIMMEGATECRPRLAFGGKLDEQHPKCQ
jgi:acetolactate synthase-1/2/3 large subunit